MGTAAESLSCPPKWRASTGQVDKHPGQETAGMVKGLGPGHLAQASCPPS